MTFATILSWGILYKYPLLGLGTLVEGPVITILAGLLLRLGHIHLLPAYLVLILGDLIGDTFWYAGGRYFAKPLVEKYGKFLGITETLMEKVKNIFHSHPNKILFLSKITMGFGLCLVVLTTAGAVKIPYRKFIAITFLGQMFWTAFLLSIGYMFGGLYVQIDQSFRIISLIGFGLIVCGLLYGISSYLKKRDIIEKI
jgi:membrane-associated protein